MPEQPDGKVNTIIPNVSGTPFILTAQAVFPLSLKKNITLLKLTGTDLVFILAISPGSCYLFRTVGESCLAETGAIRCTCQYTSLLFWLFAFPLWRCISLPRIFRLPTAGYRSNWLNNGGMPIRSMSMLKMIFSFPCQDGPTRKASWYLPW